MIGFTLGAVMLASKAMALWGPMAWLLAPHVEFLLVGWTVQLTMGVAFWILPRFEGGRSRGRERYAWAVFVLVNAGVVLVGVGPALGPPATLLGRVAEFAAAAAFGFHAWRRMARTSV